MSSLPAVVGFEFQFDTIDMSNNEIKKLENFPRYHRLKTLLVSERLPSPPWLPAARGSERACVRA